MARAADRRPRAGNDIRDRRAEPAAARVQTPSRRARREGLVIFGLPSALFVGLILVLPLVALAYRTLQAGALPTSLRSPIVVQSLQLSAWTSTITVLLAIAFGLPLAYVLARWQFPGRRIVDTLVDLPLVLPPVVAGVGLLMAFGRRGLLGERLDTGFTVPLLGWHVGGLSISFSTTAVILAQVFVATPFFIRAARAGFAQVEQDIEEAAALDGASPWQTFRLVTVPLALPALSSGLVLCWARAAGEFGATMMFAGNLPGRTQTMPLAIMSAMESDLYAALALSLLLVVVSFALLFLYRLIGNRHGIEV